MIDPANVPEVSISESLARYLFSRSHFRSSNNTVKADAFMPPPDREMSVTRHLCATETELWDVGKAVGLASGGRTLRGRADIGVSQCVQHKLQVVRAETQENPNHAHIIDWPTDEDSQLSIAQELASLAVFRKCP